MSTAPHARVLLAEDDEAVRALLYDVLRADGFMVMAVENGAQAIRAFRDHDFDIVVTDLAIPEFNGLQVAKVCKVQRPSVKVILLTASNLLVDDQQCIDHGIDRLVPKPLGISTILETLHDIIDRPGPYRRVGRTST